MRKVILGIGSNLGNRVRNFHLALQSLKALGKISQTSFLYQTAPMYELNQPSFLNAAVMLETKSSPEEILHKCKDIELNLGRSSELLKVWKGPRPIDIDILFYDDLVLKSERLNIPHISIQERDFVLKPLVDLAPKFVHPVLKKNLEDLDKENDKNNPNLSHPERVWSINNPMTNQEIVFDFARKTVGMGIINCTKDSIYIPPGARGEGPINYSVLAEECKKFYDNNFEILDIGGESTRPGSVVIEPEVELSRVLPMIEKIKQDQQLRNILISLDTRKSLVADKGVAAGAAIINDISGGAYDDGIIDIAAQNNIPYVIMHSRGTPQTMSQLNKYTNIIEEVTTELQERIDIAIRKGVYKWNIIVDPGIGMAKKRDQNMEIFKNLNVFGKNLPYPVLVGFSNKKFIKEIMGDDNTSYGNSILTGISIQKGAAIIRTHEPLIGKSILFADNVYKNRKIYF